MKVLVDGRPLYDNSRTRGFGRYLRAVLGRLATRDDLSLAALVVRGTPVPAGVAAVRVRRAGPPRLADLEHRLRLPRDLAGVRSDVYWSPGVHPPGRCHIPWVQTLYDATPVVDPDPGHRTERRRWRRRMEAMRSASSYIAISTHTAEEAASVLGLDRARMHVVPLGVDSCFRPPACRPRVVPPYILYVGEYGPSKGYREAMALIDALPPPLRLKVVGRLETWNRAPVHAMASQRADLLDHVSDRRLTRLYQGAAALVVTSRREGFGLPAAEAMACGTPVVSFANTALTETVDTGGVLVADGDVEAMASEVARLLDDSVWWRELSQRALARARAFDWDHTAAEHARVFASVA